MSKLKKPAGLRKREVEETGNRVSLFSMGHRFQSPVEMGGQQGIEVEQPGAVQG